MSKFFSFITLVFSSILLLGGAAVQAAPKGGGMNARKLDALIVKARAGDVSAAEELAEASRKVDVGTVNDTTIQNMASLLDSTNGAVRMWVAGALGNFGSRAASYVPRLQQIVSEEACNMTGFGPADSASAALRKMGITPKPAGCVRQE